MPGIADQYRTIAAAAGWRRRRERGRLRFTGRDRLSFLQALLTNEVAGLASGQGVYAAYLTPQGRMIADLHIHARPDHLIADVPAAGASSLAEAFDRLIFAEDVAVTDESASSSQITVAGGDAAGAIARALEIDGTALQNLPSWSHVGFEGGFAVRADDARLPIFDVLVATDREASLIDALQNAGVSPISGELATALRVDAGRPLFGVDMDADTIPLEAGLLERAISTTKGCYVGQEVIVRVLHRGGGRVARRLVKVRFDRPVADRLESGTTLSSGDREIGVVTSFAPALDGAGTIALAFVKRDHAEVSRGVAFGLPEITGTITEIVE